jgi:hypothetical protein
MWMIVQPSTWNEQAESCETMLFLAASGESVFNSPQTTHYPTSTGVCSSWRSRAERGIKRPQPHVLVEGDNQKACG